MNIDELLHRYEQALATKTWEEVEPLIHDSCAFVFTEGTFVGKEQAKEAFERTFQTIENEQYSISDIRWIYQSDNTAICTSRFDWSGTINGEERTGSGRGTNVFVKEFDSWYLVHEHLGPLARSVQQ